MDIEHPLSIRSLSMIEPDPDIGQFKNLEHLRIAFASDLDVSILSALPKLKRVDIDPNSLEEVSVVNQLIKQKKKLKRHALRLFYKEVELTRFVFGFEFKEQSKLAWQMKNYPLLASKISSPTHIDYAELLRTTPTLPEDFFDRYINIQEVTLSSLRRRGQASFLNFLRNCRNLSYLTFCQCKPDQDLLDRLPDVCSIFGLKILDSLDLTDQVELDYTFLNRMPELRNFETGRKLAPDAIWSLTKMARIQSFTCLLSYYVQVRVDKRSDGRFDCYTGKKKTNRDDLSRSELIEWCGFLRFSENGESDSDLDHSDRDVANSESDLDNSDRDLYKSDSDLYKSASDSSDEDYSPDRPVEKNDQSGTN